MSYKSSKNPKKDMGRHKIIIFMISLIKGISKVADLSIISAKKKYEINDEITIMTPPPVGFGEICKLLLLGISR